MTDDQIAQAFARLSERLTWLENILAAQQNELASLRGQRDTQSQRGEQAARDERQTSVETAHLLRPPMPPRLPTDVSDSQASAPPVVNTINPANTARARDTLRDVEVVPHTENASTDQTTAPAAPSSTRASQTYAPVVDQATAQQQGSRQSAREDRTSQAKGQSFNQTPFTAATGEARHQQQQEQQEDATRAAKPLPKLDLESRIGGRWLNRIGVVAVAIGVAFFLKYAFDNEWIGKGGQVGLSALIGVAGLAGGELLRRRGYRYYAHGITGGGIMILYSTIYAAFAAYQLIDSTVAFVLMIATTAAAVLLAARHDALPIAVLSLLGGFLTPILISTGSANETGLFTYIALLDAGVLALARIKRWRSLHYMAFVGTVLMVCAFIFQYYPAVLREVPRTLQFLTLFFVIFAALPFVNRTPEDALRRGLDVLLQFANSFFYFALGYALLTEGYDHLLGSFAALVTGLHLALFFIAARFPKRDVLLSHTYLGLGFTALMMAVAIQFDQQVVTILWATLGAVLSWIGLRSNEWVTRRAGLVFLIVAAVHWLTIDVPEVSSAVGAGAGFMPLLNRRAASCAAIVAACAVALWLYKRYADTVAKVERERVSGALLVAANAFVVLLLSVDINDYFEALELRYFQRLAPAAREAFTSARFDLNKLAALVAVWSVYGAALVACGVRFKQLVLRVGGFALIALAVFASFLLPNALMSVAGLPPFLNPSFAAYALLVAALWFASFVYTRNPGALREGEQEVVLTLVVVAGNVLALAALSLEAYHFFAGRADEAMSDSRWLIQQAALSAVWTLYACGLVLVGFRRGKSLLRWMGLGLLAAAIIKSFVLHVPVLYSSPEDAPLFVTRLFASFWLPVAVLWIVASLYTRRAAVLSDDEREVVTAATVVGNILAIITLSLEALNFFAARGADANALANGVSGITRDARLAQQVALSVVWTLYASGLLVVGFVRGKLLLRWMGLGLLGLTIFKVFLLDMSSLDRAFRIISFIVLGAILLVVSFLYQRRGRNESAAPDDEVNADEIDK